MEIHNTARETHPGVNGNGPMDYAIDRFFDLLKKIGKTIGVTEVKREDFRQGIAQNIVQLESTLNNRKRKASEIEVPTVDKVFGIVTDAEKWYCLECTFDEEKPTFKLST